jgi:hypothetical protein
MKPIKGAALASMVAAMFAAGCGGASSTTPDAGTQAQSVKCAGINSCSGKGSCAGTLGDGGMHDCAGKNECAGQGWIEVASAQECTTKGGTVIQ